MLINSYSDFAWSFAESRAWGDSGRVIVEEFIHGLQLSTESFLLNGKCFTAAFCERNYSRIDEFRPYIIEDGGTIPAVLTEPLKESINDLIFNGARALGISGRLQASLSLCPSVLLFGIHLNILTLNIGRLSQILLI